MRTFAPPDGPSQLTGPITIQLLGCVCHVGRSLSCNDILSLLDAIRVRISSQASDNLLHHLQCGRWSSWLRREHLSSLVHDKYTSSGSLGRLLQANRTDQSLLRIAQQRVLQLLLLHKVLIGFWRIIAQSIDAQSSLGKIVVCVAEQANLRGAYKSTRVSPGQMDILTFDRAEALRGFFTNTKRAA